MDALTFIASLVEHLATPVAALIALKVLLKHAPQIGRFVKSVRYKDVEINLRDEFEKAKEAAETIELTKPETTNQAARDEQMVIQHKDKILQLADIDTGVAISEIWKNIEGSLIRLMQHNGLMRFTRPDKLVVWLASRNKIGAAELELFSRLRQIRNAAVHGGFEPQKISLAEVFEFKDFANLFIERIEEIRANPESLDYPIPNTGEP